MKRLALFMRGCSHLGMLFSGQAQDDSYPDSRYASFVNFIVASYFNELKEKSCYQLYNGSVVIYTEPPLYVSCDEDSITLKCKEFNFAYYGTVNQDLNKITCPFNDFPSGKQAFDKLVAFLKNQTQ